MKLPIMNEKSVDDEDKNQKASSSKLKKSSIASASLPIQESEINK